MSGGGYIVTLLESFIEGVRRRFKVQRFGRDDLRNPYEAAPFGEDGNPPDGIKAIYMETNRIGKPVIVGYVNVNQIAEVAKGEKRIYSTNENGDSLAAFIHLKNDGTIQMLGTGDFLVRYNELETAFNQLQSDHDDLVDLFNNHVHSGVIVSVSGGSGAPAVGTPGNTAVPTTTGSGSTADITPAKIDEIQTP